MGAHTSDSCPSLSLGLRTTCVEGSAAQSDSVFARDGTHATAHIYSLGSTAIVSLCRLPTHATRVCPCLPQGEWNDMQLVPTIAAFPELFPLPRVGMSHGHWLKLFQRWIAPALYPPPLGRCVPCPILAPPVIGCQPAP